MKLANLSYELFNWLNLLLVSWNIYSTYGVDRNNFKTCQQSSFCRRHRNLEPGNSPYEILLNSLKISEESLSVDVINTINHVTFILELYPLEDSTFRIKFNEKNTLHPRFEEPYSLLGTIKGAKYEVLERTSQSFKVKFGENQVVVTGNPFKLDFYQKDILALSLNSRGLLKFEHYRSKGNAEEVPRGSEDNPNEFNEISDEETDTDGLWEETFKGHTDSKPKGPASVGLDISFLHSQHVYGIPEHADNLRLKETQSGDPYRLYNLDVFEYELDNNMALYGAVPVIISHSSKLTTAVFWHNAAETWIDIKNLPNSNVVSSITGLFSGSEKETSQVSTHWISESGIIDVFVMLGDKPMDVFRQYAKLTGTTPLPPMFSLAYHQCRWNYNDEKDVQDVHDNFDKYNLPMDVMWLDIEHTDGKSMSSLVTSPWFTDRVLMVGDSRVTRLENKPDAILCSNVDFYHRGGIQLPDLINLVDEKLESSHAVIILVGLLGDETKPFGHSLADNAFATIIKSRGDDTIPTVLYPQIREATDRWRLRREGIIIIWTVPYYLDIASYNRKIVAPVFFSDTLRALSLHASEHFVKYIGKLTTRWNTALPGLPFYRLNSSLFQGRGGGVLASSFGGSAEDYRWPANQLSDGIHMSTVFTIRLWKFLETCVGQERRRMHPAHPQILPPPQVLPTPQVEEAETVEITLEEVTVVPNKRTAWRKARRQRIAAAKRASPYNTPSQQQRFTKRSVHHRLRDNRWTTTSSHTMQSGPSSSFQSQQWGMNSIPSNGPSTSAPQPIPPPESWTIADHNRAIQLATDRLMTQAAKEHMDDVRELVRITRRRGMAAAEAGSIREVELMGKSWTSNTMVHLNAPNPAQAIPFPELIATLPQNPHP